MYLCGLMAEKSLGNGKWDEITWFLSFSPIEGMSLEAASSEGKLEEKDFSLSFQDL